MESSIEKIEGDVQGDNFDRHNEGVWVREFYTYLPY
jgi:hypothetical protein